MTPRVPMPSVEVPGESRAPVEGNDANFTVPFIFDHHVTCALDDVHIAVVSRRQDRRSAKSKAPHAPSQILWAIGLHISPGLQAFISGSDLPPRCSGRPLLLCHRRDSAI